METSLVGAGEMRTLSQQQRLVTTDCKAHAYESMYVCICVYTQIYFVVYVAYLNFNASRWHLSTFVDNNLLLWLFPFLWLTQHRKELKMDRKRN